MDLAHIEIDEPPHRDGTVEGAFAFFVSVCLASFGNVWLMPFYVEALAVLGVSLPIGWVVMRWEARNVDVSTCRMRDPHPHISPLSKWRRRGNLLRPWHLAHSTDGISEAHLARCRLCHRARSGQVITHRKSNEKKMARCPEREGVRP